MSGLANPKIRTGKRSVWAGLAVAILPHEAGPCSGGGFEWGEGWKTPGWKRDRSGGESGMNGEKRTLIEKAREAVGEASRKRNAVLSVIWSG